MTRERPALISSDPRRNLCETSDEASRCRRRLVRPPGAQGGEQGPRSDDEGSDAKAGAIRCKQSGDARPRMTFRQWRGGVVVMGGRRRPAPSGMTGGPGGRAGDASRGRSGGRWWGRPGRDPHLAERAGGEAGGVVGARPGDDRSDDAAGGDGVVVVVGVVAVGRVQAGGDDRSGDRRPPSRARSSRRRTCRRRRRGRYRRRGWRRSSTRAPDRLAAARLPIDRPPTRSCPRRCRSAPCRSRRWRRAAPARSVVLALRFFSDPATVTLPSVRRPSEPPVALIDSFAAGAGVGDRQAEVALAVLERDAGAAGEGSASRPCRRRR